MFRRLFIALSLGALPLAATACNTVKGAGQDIQSVGQAGHDAIHGK
jgi:predicted small secreted protein